MNLNGALRKYTFDNILYYNGLILIDYTP